MCLSAILAAGGPSSGKPPRSLERSSTLDAPKRFAPARGGVAARGLGRGRVAVVIRLSRQPMLAAALGPASRAALAARMTSADLRQARRGGGAPRPGLAAAEERRRQAALTRIRATARRAAVSQRGIADEVRARGGRITDRDPVTNSVTAVLAAKQVEALRARADVSTITPAERPHPLGLDWSAQAVGAPSFWAAGLTGGRGPADRSPVDLAILGDKIQEDHPAFAGITFQRPSDAPLNTPCGETTAASCVHGTAVASLAISRGASGCGICVADDAGQKGVAPGLDTVLDADWTQANPNAWPLGVRSNGIAGAADPAEVMSGSYGLPTATDDAVEAQNVDMITSTYGVFGSFSAGNDGPTPQTVQKPCIAYNAVCAAAFHMAGTQDPSDDAVADFSSRGPTVGGRKKPDLAALGVTAYAERRWNLTGFGLWQGRLEGTSFANPQIAAGAALLAGSGVSDPVAQRALLFNSARRGRATPASAMGTQVGWQPDWGWGALDLDEALTEIANFQVGSVPAGGVRLYRAAVAGPGERATLVWNRRGYGCVQNGCLPTTYTLTNLDLQQVDADSGAELPSAQPSDRPAGVEPDNGGTKDNVEQVRSAGAGSVVYKVEAASSIDGLSAEPFALAARRPLTALANPQPSVALSAATTEIRPHEPVTLTATVANPSPDLTGQGAQVMLELPAGVALAAGSGAATQSLGTLDTAGRPGSSATATWTVEGTADGLASLTARAQASRYGETFEATDSEAVRVDGTAPVVNPATPVRLAGSTIGVAWSGSDLGSGLGGYDVDASVDGGSYAPWLSSVAQTSATFGGQAGHRYRFRVRARDRLGNVSAYAETTELAIPAPGGGPGPIATPGLEPPAVGPGTGAPVPAPALAIARTTPAATRVAVAGTLDPRALGPVALTLSARVGGRTVRVRGAATAAGGTFEAALRLPRALRRARSATLTVTYPGDALVGAQTVTRRIRLRR